MRKRIEKYGTFAGLSNGGEIFAAGGFVCPADGVGSLSAMGVRCPIVGAVDPFVRDGVLTHLDMEECRELRPKSLVWTFWQWLEAAYGSYPHPETFWVVDDIDPAYQVCPILLGQQQLDVGLHPSVQIHSLSELLTEIGIGPDQRPAFTERVLGKDWWLEGPNHYHPNNLGERTMRLARAAHAILAVRG